LSPDHDISRKSGASVENGANEWSLYIFGKNETPQVSKTLPTIQVALNGNPELPHFLLLYIFVM